MKVLIVDDESHVRDAIQLLLEWDSYGFDTVLTADSVEEAQYILQKQKPELLIVDVVIGPVLGMDILNYINDQKMETKSIVISGHDDFQYVRAMFILGAIEYLLKPIEQDKLEAAVQKAVSQMKAEPNEEKFVVDKQFKHISPDYQHGLLRKLFRPELMDRAYEELKNISTPIQKADACCILHCSGSTLPVHEEGYLLKLSRFINRIQDKLETEGKGTVFQNMKPSMDIVILVYGAKQMDFMAEVMELKTAWEEARTAADHVAGNGLCMLETYVESLGKIRLKENLKLENAMYSAVILGNIIEFEDKLNEWVASVTDGQPCSVGIYRSLWDSFFNIYKKWGNDSDVPEEEIFSGIVIKNFGDILSGSWHEVSERMSSYFLMCASLLMDCRRQVQNVSGLMAKIVDYLEMNYMKKISQQEIADYFHVNKDYLIRAFKKYTGIGMAKYLNNIRIQKSKELLRSTNLSVMEIADQVGYFDAKYFSRQFKLACAVTPAQYRQSI